MRRPPFLFLFLVITAASLLACADTVTGTMPPAVPDPAPTVAPRADTGWALSMRHRAIVKRKPLVKLRWCLGWTSPSAVPSPPSRLAEQSLWTRYGIRCRTLARSFNRERSRLLNRILHPESVSAASWRPLLKYLRWPSSQLGNATTCIRRESSGNPRALNSSSGCAGLFQLSPGHWAGHFDPFDARLNAAYSLRLWRRSGWSPWSTM